MEFILISLLISLAIQLVLFIPAFVLKTDKLTDFSYSLTFIALGFAGLLLNRPNALKTALFLMVFAWGIRLGLYLFVRINKIKKDKRFDDIRDNLFKFGSFWLLQGISVWLIMIPVTLYFNSADNQYNWLVAIGALVWFAGLVIESAADWQKYSFFKDSTNKGKWIQSGLWKYSRHPNYFGEILVWLGIYIFTASAFNTANLLIAAVSPLYISFILIFVTGLPKLEKAADKKWRNNPEYQIYKKRTSVLLPLPPKK